MKFSIPSKVLSESIAAVSKIVESRQTVPILANIVITAEDGGIVLTGTDLDIEIQMAVPADVTELGATTIPARLSSDIAKKVVGDVTFSLVDGEQMASIGAGRSKFKLQTLPVDDFPNMKSGEFTHSFTLNGTAITALFGKTEFAISNEETRYYLNGTFFHDFEGQKLRAVATDGHRLARAEIDIPEEAIGMPAVIVPRKTVRELLSLAGAAKGDAVAVDISDTKIRFSHGSTVLTSKLISGTFPDYQRVIPTGNNLFAKVDSKALAAAADRVSTVSTERSKAVKLHLENGSMTLTTNSPEAGSAEEVIDLDYDADPMAIGFNSRYVADVVRNLGDGEAKITLGDPGSPTIFTSEKEPGLLIVLMPVRIGQ